MSEQQNLPLSSKENVCLPPLSENITSDDLSPALVFFDLETSGFGKNCHVLQIAARNGNQSFCKYITPNGPIPKEASEVNGLTNINDDLFLNGKKVQSDSAKIVLEEFLKYLQECGKKCVLIAHNCSFDAPRLLRIINEASLTTSFEAVVDGFVDTLSLFRKKFPKTKCKLTILAGKSFTVDPEKMHDAVYDVLVLQNVAFLHFSRDELLSKVKDFRKMADFPRNFESLEPLNTCISLAKKRKMSTEGVSYNKLVAIYEEKGQEGVKELLEQKDSNGKKIIGSRKIMNKILEHLQDRE